MRSELAQAIRDARLAIGLTQEELARRLGLKGRAVYRWERDDSAPRRRHRAALIAAVNAVNQSAGATLAAAISSVSKGRRGGATVAAASAPPPSDTKLAVELAIFGFADELDLPPRRVRLCLGRLLKRLRETNVTLETVERQLEAANEVTVAGPQP
jgi:transcriptional regulator with XRE-family HTH domain